MSRVRADVLLVSRGLAESRAKARAAIEAGGVTADGAIVEKPSDLLREDAALEATAPHPWVSRGGVKLAAALDAFGVDPRGRVCLDVGASTGGFTDVLLARGAAKVYAVDVGGGQLHARLRADARVASLEHTDARALTRDHIPEAPSLIVCDVSFIGAAKALAAPLSLAAARADLIALIKPQFEAGPHKRAVLDEATARAAGEQAIAALDGLAGFARLAAIDSPIRGGDGNLELLLHARRSPARGRGGDPGAKQGATEG
ncbi:MAG: TlyA family RNA methyltransferase [Hyphomonadaceae bacterium]|nr:TlyA family RNA methyltransferase [Hyphomonadaceae bacterium]